MAVPSKFKGVLNLIPGAMNYVDLEDKRVGPLYQISVDIDRIENKIVAVQNRVEKAFYTDLFLLITAATGTMTATEVMEKQEEKLLLLGPTVERQIESLDNIIDVVFEFADERGMIPPPPPELEGQELKVEYISLLAQAQKLVMANSINAYLAVAERVSVLWPGSVIKTDANEVLDQYADIVGVPSKIIRPDDEVEEIEATQQQAAQQLQQMEAMQAGAGIAKDLGGASTASDTALGSLKEGLESL